MTKEEFKKKWKIGEEENSSPSSSKGGAITQRYLREKYAKAYEEGASALNDIYSGWQSPEQGAYNMDMARNAIKSLSDIGGQYGDTSFGNHISTLVNNYLGAEDALNAYSGFVTADAYNKAQKKFDFANKYRGASYDDIQKALASATDIDEQKFLKRYTDYSSLEDFDKAIEAEEKIRQSVNAKDVKSINQENLKKARDIFEKTHASEAYDYLLNEEDFAELSQDSFALSSYEKSIAFDPIRMMQRGNIAFSDSLNDEDRAKAIYLFNSEKYGEDAYLDYMNKMTYVARQNEANEMREDLSAQREEHPVLSAIEYPLFDAFMGGAAGIESLVSMARDKVNSLITGEKGYYNPTTLGTLVSVNRKEIAEISNNIKENAGGLPAFAYDVFATGVPNRIGQMMYGPVYNVVMGSQVFATNYADAVLNGESPEAAVLNALVAGGLETLTEWKGMEWAFGEGKNAITKVLKQAFAEGSEEVVSSLGYLIYDKMKNGGEAEFNQNVNKYVEMGYSREEAKKKASADYIKDVAYQFAVAAFSTVPTTGVAEVSRVAQESSAGKFVNREKMAEISDEKLQKKYGEEWTKKATNREIYKAYGNYVEGLQNESTKAEKEATRKAIAEEYKMTEEQADKWVEALYNGDKKLLKTGLGVMLTNDVRKNIGFTQKIDNTETEKIATKIRDAFKMIKSDNEMAADKAAKVIKTGEKNLVNGKEAEVISMKENKDGSYTVKTSEGEVKASDVTVTENKATALTYSANIENEALKEAYVRYYAGEDIADYDTYARYLYEAGRHGADYSDETQIIDALGKAKAQAFYNIGALEAVQEEIEDNKALEAVTKKYAEKFRPGTFKSGEYKNGKFKENKDFFRNLNRTQKKLYRIVESFSSLSGINVRVYIDREAASENGQFIAGRNGGTIYINLAARPFGDSAYGINQYVISTFSHELTHWLKANNREAYNILEEAVKKDLQKNKTLEKRLSTERETLLKTHENELKEAGKSEEEIKAEMEKYSKKKDLDEIAMEEVVARACEDMLNNADTMQEVLSFADQDGLTKLQNALKKWFDHIRQFFNDLMGGFHAPNEVVADLQKSYDHLRELWVNGMKEAIAQNRKAQKTAEKATSKEARNSLPMSVLENMSAEDSKNYRAFFKVVNSYLAGTYPKRQHLKVMDYTPSLLQRIGLGNKEIYMTKAHYNDITHPEDGIHDQYHGLSDEEVIQAPVLLNNAAIILDSITKPSSVIVVSQSLDYQNRPIMMALKTDGEAQGIELIDSNFMTSMYGKDGFTNWLDQFVQSNDVLYIDSKKIQALKGCGVQFSLGFEALGFDTILHQSRNAVKSNHLKSTKLDNVGRKLTEDQVNFFADESPLLLDESGRLKRYYHGTARKDRVGYIFSPEKATSGPMAYFTDSEEIATNYSKDKADTSISRDDRYNDYHTQFRITINGQDMSISDAWNKLPSSKRNEIKQKAEHVTLDDEAEEIIYDPNNKEGIGDFNAYEINFHKGNYIDTLVSSWLDSGTLWQRESDFLKVLEMVGFDLKDITYLDPNYSDAGVYEVYLHITNPLDTGNIPSSVIKAIRDASKTAKFDAEASYTADMWDKSNVSPQKFMERFEDDIKNGSSHWATSIPDWATDVFKSLGYDGIVDKGGKFHEVEHQVVIPFYSEQVKDINNEHPTTNPDIRKSAKMDLNKKNPISFKGKAFWSGSVSLLDGAIEEVHTYEEAERADFHHSLYFSDEQVEKLDSDDNAFFFVNNGEIEMWRDDIPQWVIGRIYEQLDSKGKDSEVETIGAADVDTKTGTAVYSVRYTLAERYKELGYNSYAEAVGKTAADIAKKMGVSKLKAEQWIKAEESLASLILKDAENQRYLDYVADNRYSAIKTDTDYPQGTIDLSNLCRKREIFTKMFDSLQRENPDVLFTAEDIAKIRQILTEANYEVACALCYVEDRRQKIGEISQSFIDNYKKALGSKTKVIYRTNSKGKVKPLKITKRQAETYGLTQGDYFKATDPYVPNQYDLTTYQGYKELTEKHPMVAAAFENFNNARGQSAARLIEGHAEYKREILNWSEADVNKANNLGGLRVFSFSDFEAIHLIDIVQVVMDCSAKGVMIQAYTKVPSFANLVKDTGIKLNRSLIPANVGSKNAYAYVNGKAVKIDSDMWVEDGIALVDGKEVLVFDTVEGIDITDENFLDMSDNKNVGNILVGISEKQIRLAMEDDFIDYIIPFHTNQAKAILEAKGIHKWDNYKLSQLDKKVNSKGKDHGINIYTDVINKYKIRNKNDFVRAFLNECKNQKYKPRFAEFLNKNSKGDYIYTEGYHKFLVDYKLFDKNGNILKQEAVKPDFDQELMNKILMADKARSMNMKFSDEIMDKVRKELSNENRTVKSVKMDSTGRTLTPGQQDFFKNSKARDDQGRLLVMFHGSKDFGFTIFNPDKSDDKRSLFFTDSKGMASTYVEDKDKIYEVYLNLQNPFILDAYGGYWNGIIVDEDLKILDEAAINMYNYVRVVKRLIDYNVDLQDVLLSLGEFKESAEFFLKEAEENEVEYTEEEKAELLDAAERADESYRNWNEAEHLDENGEPQSLADYINKHWVTSLNTRQLAERAKEQGYDGVIIKNVHDNGKFWKQERVLYEATVAIAFDGDQVKAVTNENPTEDRDIFKSTKLSPEAQKLVDELTLENKRLTEENTALKAEKGIEKAKAEKKAIIDKITEQSQVLSRWLLTNDKNNPVPQSIKEPLGKLLTSINFTKDDYEWRKERGHLTKAEESLGQRMAKISQLLLEIDQDKVVDKDAYDLSQLDWLPTFSKEFVQIKDAIAAVEAREGEAFTLSKMTTADLQNLSNMITALKTAITNMNKCMSAHNKMSVSGIGRAIVDYLDEVGQKKIDNRALQFLEIDNTVPFYFFKRLGSGGQQAFKLLMDGMNQYAFEAKQIEDYAKKTFSGKDVNAWRDQVKTFEIDQIEYSAEQGEDLVQSHKTTIRMTVPQIMSLYCLSKRDQAQNHLQSGGIRIGDFRVKSEKEPVRQVDNVTLTKADLQKIISSLDEDQKNVADKLQEFMNTTLQKWGNEVTMKRFGFKGMTEKNYFPIAVDRNVLSSQARQKGTSLYQLLNMGFTKPINPKAKNPIEIFDIFEVFAMHSTEMAQYHSLALPVLDVIRIWNYKDLEMLDEGEDKAHWHSVKASIENTIGAKGNAYIGRLLADLNGDVSGGRADDLASRFMKNYKTAAVAANLQVAALQPLSYIRAGYMIDSKYLTKGMAMKSTDDALKWCGIAVWKNMGFYNTAIHRGLEHKIMQDETKKESIVEKGLYLAGKADEWTWSKLWNACLLETKDKYPNLEGDELYKKTAERLTEVIYGTQVVDSILTRSEIMRDPTFYSKMITAFQSEPTLALNVLMDAGESFSMEARAHGKQAALQKHGATIRRAATIYLISSAVESALRAVIGKIRGYDGDDDDETIVENFLKRFIEELNPLRKIPLIKDAWSVLIDGIKVVMGKQYRIYTDTRMDEAIFENIGKSVIRMFKLIEGKEANFKALYEIAKGLDASGLPVSSTFRAFKVLWNNTIGRIWESLLLK